MPSKTKAKAATFKPRIETPHDASLFTSKAQEDKPLNAKSDRTPPSQLLDRHNPSPTAATTSVLQTQQIRSPDVNGAAPGVNRKKQKRRMKEAAKKAAMESSQVVETVNEVSTHSMPKIILF